MSQNKKQDQDFSIKKVKNTKTIWNQMYSDDVSLKRRYDRTPSTGSDLPSTAEEVRELLLDGLTTIDDVVQASRKLYAVNPLYANVINYLSNMFNWRYKVTPHRAYNKSKTKSQKTVSDQDFQQDYNLMLEAADGLNIETKFPALLKQLFIEGSVFFTTLYNEEQVLVDILILPVEKCRRIGETQYGTNIIQFDMQFFDGLGLNATQLDEFLATYPQEIQKAYKSYKSDSSLRWAMLDPTYSTCLTMNAYGIPTYFYLYASILNYEKYQDNELERSNELLKYIVVQTMPIYQDKLVFEMDEVSALHKSMKKIIDKGDQARLLTTYGDVKVERIAEDESTQSDVLAKALEAVYDNGGFNPTFFNGESVTALEMALVRDQNFVWNFIQQLATFFTLAINNYLKLKFYEADIEILKISSYNYKDDMERFKNNATLGVGKLDYIVASGIKQKNIADALKLEEYLHLDQITPMQTSYTQTAEDRESEEDSADTSSKSSKETGIEPSESKEDSEKASSTTTE